MSLAASLTSSSSALTVSSLVPFDANLSMHERAILVAQRTIEFLNYPISRGIFEPLREELVISSEDEERIQSACLESYDELMSTDNKEVGDFIAIGKGHHAQVYTHKEYPHLVFRFETEEEALAQVDASRRAIQLANREGLYFYEIPAATSISLPGKQNYFEKPMAVHVSLLVPIPFNGNAQADVMNRVLLHYLNGASSTFKTNVQEIARQMAVIIGEIGYWDIQHGNGPQFSIDGSRVILIDFEKIKVTPKPSHQIEGFQRLSRMFAIAEITEVIQQVALERVSLTAEKLKDDYQDKRALSESRAIQTALKAYDQRGISRAHPFVPTLPFPEQILKPETLQVAQEIVARAATALENTKEDSIVSLTTARIVYLQPCSMLNYRGVSNETTIEAVQALQAQGVIVAVSGENEYADSDRDPRMYSYLLYF